ncbi:TolC family protein [Bizionia sediminis]|uniref:TolC family protein n=1 Tax=Bizionia sediminis TaxID=1737064 RepID=A0ABW5KSZ0_9FLAO
MKPAVTFLWLIIFPYIGVSQATISLETCYNLLAENYPLVQQKMLIENQRTLNLAEINAGKLPQINLDAQAVYLSDVTQIPLPDVAVNPPNNDQYKATLSINQLIFGNGQIAALKSVKSAELNTQQKHLDVQLYNLKQQVNSFYFSILHQMEHHRLLQAKKRQLEQKLQEVKSGIAYGVILPASDNVIVAELLKIEQQSTEVISTKTVLMQSLSALLGTPISINTTFETPEITVHISDSINRPEMALFALKKEEIESKKELIQKEISPKLVGFASGGYGNPGLNMLDNSFQTFYTVGVKLQWSVFDWQINKKKRQSLQINQNRLDNDAEIFHLNTSIAVNAYEQEISKISSMLQMDLEIIALRKHVLKSTESQLQNGVIPVSNYITELTNLFEAENRFAQHSLTLQLAKANYNLAKGH